MGVIESPENGIKVEEEEIDHGHQADPDGDPIPASFAGRLDLSSFKYTLRSQRHNNDTDKITKPQSAPPDSHRNTRRSLASPSPSSSTLLLSRTRSQTQSPKRKLPLEPDTPGLSPSSLSPSRSSPSKKRRSPSSYAPPSTYAHLPHLPDVLAPNLLVLFVGLNPGIETARSGHAYAHPSNLFWKLLHSSGCTTRRLSPTEDRDLPRLFSMGNTNIVARPTRNGGELSKNEMDESVNVLVEKVRKWEPECVCLVGKGIWESVWRVRKGRPIRKEEFRYGWQSEEEDFIDTRGRGEVKKEGKRRLGMVFVATSTSGLAASLLPHEKEAIWRELGAWVERRREERAAEIDAALGNAGADIGADTDTTILDNQTIPEIKLENIDS
ncbi:mismatch-specific thymine-DNA glycosylate [Xylogone sp. PMI_703]|nr:mismatch-specific thymine-DNA glycosylate [Xylogone sp. PMI_703]